MFRFSRVPSMPITKSMRRPPANQTLERVVDRHHRHRGWVLCGQPAGGEEVRRSNVLPMTIIGLFLPTALCELSSGFEIGCDKYTMGLGWISVSTPG